MAVEIGGILDVVRSGYDATEKLIALVARNLAVRAELMNEAVKNNQSVNFSLIATQAADILSKEKSTVEKTTVDNIKNKTAFLEIPAAVGLLIRGVTEIVELASRPTPGTAAILAVMPPPVVVALYAIVAAVNLVKSGFEAASLVSQQSNIIFGNLNEAEKKEAVQQRNKTLMNLGQSVLAIAASSAMIAAAFFAPGSTNLLGASFLAVSVALTGSRILYGGAKGSNETVKEIFQTDSVHNKNAHQHTVQHEEKKEHTENLGKALGAYLTALAVVYTQRWTAASSPPPAAVPELEQFTHKAPKVAEGSGSQAPSAEKEAVKTVIVEPKKGAAIESVAVQSAVARASEAAKPDETAKLK